MGTGGKQWSAALVACAGDQWSLIFLERLRLHFLGGRRIADPSTGRLSGSNRPGFLCLDATALLVCFVQFQVDLSQGGDSNGVQMQIIKHQLADTNLLLFSLL